IRFQTVVEQVIPIGTGQWRVISRPADGTTGDTISEIFDAVVVCSGLYSQPWIPQFPGAETYTGKIIHSSLYKGPEAYKGQDVVVLGVGSSGTDIATELGGVAKRVVLSTAKGAWFIPRYIQSQPYDHRLTRL